MRLSTLLSCAGLCSVVLLGSPAIGEDDAPRETPAGTAFTYQGLLKSSGAEVNESVDIKVRLYDAAIDGNQIGSEQEILGVSVVDGVFSVALDFGAQFNGNRRWVEIDVKLSSSPDPYETLAPRQEVTPSPFALFSLSTGIIPDAALTGTYTQQIDLTNTSNTIAGDGGGLTNLAASSIGDGTINSILSLTNANNTFVGDGTGLENLNWAALIGVPAGFADGIDDTGGLWSENGNDAYFNTGNVGIGTPSPSAPLEVRGDSSLPLRVAGANNAGVRIESDGTASSWSIYHDSSDDHLKFRDSTTAATRMVIRGDSGNVGIGTDSPQSALSVTGPNFATTLNGVHLGVSGIDEGVLTLVGPEDARNIIDFKTGASQGARLEYRGSTDAIAMTGALVGIGTTSPLARLHVMRSDVGSAAPASNPALALEGANGAALEFISPYGEIYFQDTDGGGTGWLTYNGEMQLGVSSSTRMVIKPSGKVGIGTNSPDGGLSVSSLVDIAPTSPGIHMGMIDYAGDEAAGLYIAADNGGIPQLRFYELDGTTNMARIRYLRDQNTLMVDGDAIDTFSVPVLQIRGGADIVEGFDTSCGTELEPGTVVVIDPDTPGALMQSTDAYDFKVAGVVSGANGISAGMHLGQDGVLDGDTKVAMTGRVYVKCSTENGAIKPGTLLTTASLAGHAMAATDASRSNGAVIGKAMSSLDEGTGLVLVLVNLQ